MMYEVCIEDVHGEFDYSDHNVADRWAALDAAIKQAREENGAPPLTIFIDCKSE